MIGEKISQDEMINIAFFYKGVHDKALTFKNLRTCSMRDVGTHSKSFSCTKKKKNHSPVHNKLTKVSSIKA